MEPRQNFQDQQFVSEPAAEQKEKKQPHWLTVAAISALFGAIGTILANHFDPLMSIISTFIGNTDRNVQLWLKAFGTPTPHQFTSTIHLPFNITIPPWIVTYSNADFAQDIGIFILAVLLFFIIIALWPGEGKKNQKENNEDNSIGWPHSGRTL